ncbi:phospholysine phosphohistidine inorganic pyrophosphate phosphatase [Trichonephila clavipes]|uniref:Phospholysine phosphohistidine inorganic pyrophosphate phosphatase n=1 Tax=Trichonephila clavipes TaxID=2585209 RepID=A0A8X6V7X9_TRICX|nr:phospholysine phosphohistidine inorganic pyrophosphate phosphatase [Trichonephila clavipes]
MDFGSYSMPKLNDCSQAVQSLDPIPQPPPNHTNAYQPPIDKNNGLHSLAIHENHDMHENPDSPPPADGSKGISEEQHLCQYCDRVYPSRTNLSRHIFQIHRVPSRKNKPPGSSNETRGAICYEEGCNNEKFKSTTELRNHLVNKHNFIFQVIKNVLETEQDFIRWKKNVEEACDIKWVKQAAKKKASGCTVVTYICHRSGKFRSSGGRRRALKSCKIGHFCTAYLKVVILEDGKGYQVELYPDHYGHDVSSAEDKKVKVQVAKCLNNPVRGILISTTGVLFENGKYEAIKGSVIAVERLRQLGIAIRFITNDSRRTPADLVKKLQSLGFSVVEDEIFSPIPVVINTLLTLGLRPYLMVHQDIRPAFDKIDQTSPNCVVIGDLGGNVSAEIFNKAYQVLTSSPSPVLVKLGNEKYYKEKNELVLGAASYAAALEYACSTEAMVVGKPCYDFIMNAVNGLGICPQEILMIGDDIENDIQAAQRCGMRAILVRTGKFRPDDAKNEVIKPDTIVKNLAHLVDMLVMKSKRENSNKCSSDGMPKYPQEHKKHINRTPKPMEVPPPVPIQPHYDVYPFRFGGAEVS